jgi:hypothetical protein
MPTTWCAIRPSPNPKTEAAITSRTALSEATELDQRCCRIASSTLALVRLIAHGPAIRTARATTPELTKVSVHGVPLCLHTTIVDAVTTASTPSRTAHRRPVDIDLSDIGRTLRGGA